MLWESIINIRVLYECTLISIWIIPVAPNQLQTFPVSQSLNLNFFPIFPHILSSMDKGTGVVMQSKYD